MPIVIMLILKNYPQQFPRHISIVKMFFLHVQIERQLFHTPQCTHFHFICHKKTILGRQEKIVDGREQWATCEI